MGSKANYQQSPVHWPREITKPKLSQAKSFFIHIFLSNNGKRGKKGNFGNFGQVWASQDKFVQGNKLENGKIGRKNKKREKKLSGYGGGEEEGGGESRVQNSPKAFGELTTTTYTRLMHDTDRGIAQSDFQLLVFLTKVKQRKPSPFFSTKCRN